MYFSSLFLSILFNLVSCKTYVSLLIQPDEYPLHVVNEKFLSIALDSSVIADHLKDFDTKNKRLYKLVEQMKPGYLRIGGNMADRLHFVKNTLQTKSYNFGFAHFLQECAYEELNYCHHNFPNFNMSGDEWININNFAKIVGFKILFDLNCLIRNEDKSWNSTNAEELISFSNDNNFSIDWQLGNEPNAFKHVFNYSVSATQLAKDYVKLRTILKKYTLYENSVLVGPEVTRPLPKHSASKKYLKEFLLGINIENILNAVSFHQYYLNGRIATKSDFLNPGTYLLLEQQINIVNKIVKNSPRRNLPVWLTETSSAYGGGAPGLSDTFIGSFLWLDKLGLSAKLGVDIVVRQSVKRDHYALIDDNYNPNPDWWLSVLYKKIVGMQVINCTINAPNTVRLYCHCSKNSKVTSVTVFGINFSNSTVYIRIQGVESNFNNSAFILTPKDNNLLIKQVLLNGKLLELSEDADLPTFHPKYVDVSKPLEMPAYSLAFWTFLAENVKACSPLM